MMGERRINKMDAQQKSVQKSVRNGAGMVQKLMREDVLVQSYRSEHVI